MIRLVEALNFRCLRYIRQSLKDFQVLIGPNASGKTTFLDVVAFLGDLLSKGLDDAITLRSSTIHDLFFFHEGQRFQLAVELQIPTDRKKMFAKDETYRYVRYEISIGIEEERNDIQIFDEQVILLNETTAANKKTQRTLFPLAVEPPDSIMHGKQVGGYKKRVVRKVYDGNDNFYSEV